MVLVVWNPLRKQRARGKVYLWPREGGFGPLKGSQTTRKGLNVKDYETSP